MKVNVNGKEVDIYVNNEKQKSSITKKKLSDRNLTADEVVRQAKQAEKTNAES